MEKVILKPQNTLLKIFNKNRPLWAFFLQLLNFYGIIKTKNVVIMATEMVRFLFKNISFFGRRNKGKGKFLEFILIIRRKIYV